MLKKSLVDFIHCAFLFSTSMKQVSVLLQTKKPSAYAKGFLLSRMTGLEPNPFMFLHQ